MTNTERITAHNTSLRECIEIAENLPDAGGGRELVIQPLEITENGTYAAPSGVDGYSPVTVTVLTGDGGDGGYFQRLLDEGELSDNSVTTLPNDFCRGWLYLKKIDFPNVTNVGTYLCYNCTKLVEVNMPKCDTMGMYCFYNANALTSINFPKIKVFQVNTFKNCTSLVDVNIPECKTVNSYTFMGCSSLEKIDFPKVNWVGAQVFNGCTSLTALILRSTTVCTMSNSTNFFNGTPIASGTGYIYVPSALVDSYKTATNWVNYANQIRAIEDYPEICG